MKKIIIIFLLALASSNQFCQKEEVLTVPEIENELDEKSIQVEVYYSWIENARIRTKPGKTEKVIGSLKEGDEVIYLGQKSDFTDTFKLREQDYTEPWLFIQTKNKVKGWVFGGALKKMQSTKK